MIGVFKVESALWTRGDLHHTGQAYSAHEKQRASAVDLSVSAFDTHLEFANFPRVKFLVFILAFSFSTCDLKLSDL